MRKNRLFHRVCSDRTGGNGFKRNGFKPFRLDIRKKFSARRMVRYWNRLSKGVVDAPSPEALNVRLGGL